MEVLEGLWSPCLCTLQQRLEEGNTTALLEFWQDICAKGTPLVEVAENDRWLVTLLWCETGKRLPGEVTCSLGGILNSRKMAHVLFPLDGCNVWYRTYRLPAQVRATYHFFVNGEATSDPLSKKPFCVPADEVSVYLDKEIFLGVVELPGAKKDVWVEPGTEGAHGDVQSFLFPSKIVQHDYRLTIYTPHGYQRETGMYPLLLLYDAWTYTQVIPTPTILDTMIADGVLPPLVAVLFGHRKREERMREMGFYEPFFDCVSQELLPHIRRHYAVTHEPSHTVVAGASMGGIAALYSGLRYPELFGNVYSHTGSFQAGPKEERAYQRLAQEIQKSTTISQQRFCLDVGMLERDEMGFGSTDGGPDAVESNRFIRDVLQAQGCTVTYEEYAGGHDLLWGSTTLEDGLKVLFETMV